MLHEPSSAHPEVVVGEVAVEEGAPAEAGYDQQCGSMCEPQMLDGTCMSGQRAEPKAMQNKAGDRLGVPSTKTSTKAGATPMRARLGPMCCQQTEGVTLEMVWVLAWVQTLRAS